MCRQKECTRRRVQWNKETAYITSEWSSWEVPPESVWRSQSKRHHKGPSSLSPQATRNEFRKPLNRLTEARRGTRLTCRTNRPSKTLFTKLGAFDHLVFTAGDSLHLQDLATTDL